VVLFVFFADRDNFIKIPNPQIICYSLWRNARRQICAIADFTFWAKIKCFPKKLTGKFGDKFKSKIFRQGDKIYQQPNMQVFPCEK